MFSKKKKPSIRIPASVLKKEAEKIAKKMQKKEEKKERERLKRERSKEIAKKKTIQKKEQHIYWSDFFDEHLRREVFAGSWILLGVILIVIFFNTSAAARQITVSLQNIFGIGIWILPFICLITGAVLFWRKNIIFHPVRVVMIVLFFCTILGFLQLGVIHDDSLDLASEYGGILGFTITFFTREFFASQEHPNAMTIIFLLSILWISAKIGFGFRIHITNWRKNFRENFKKTTETCPIKKKQSISTAPTNEEDANQNIEIVDSRNQPRTQEQEIEDNKNIDFGGEWSSPDLTLLDDTHSKIVIDETALRDQAEIIREKLDQFGIEVIMKSVHVGPTVTQFTLEPSAGVKLTKITALKSDIALALGAEQVRIEAPIRGQKLVGIEIPNKKRSTVGMREIITSDSWEEEPSDLKLALGRDVSGKPVVTDLIKMPHLLIAGKTGSGKSVAMNAFLISLIWNNPPDKLRMILIDPKRVELTPYNNLPHLLTPIIVEPEKSVSALAWAVAEMNRRFKMFSEKSVKNIIEHNQLKRETHEPYIVIVVDELADLMMVAGKDVEAAICRIAQLGRAAGMHLIIATQRPSVDVVTGLIKANLPARIAFRVSSGIDSRTIIDSIGAEDLLGFGDMLSLDGNSGELRRLQGLYLANQEIERVTNHIKMQFPEMLANDEITKHSIEGMAKGGVLTAGVDEIDEKNLDVDFSAALDIVRESGKASASLLQRRMEIGYARAARILDQMEKKGYIGPAKGAKPRDIYM